MVSFEGVRIDAPDESFEDAQPIRESRIDGKRTNPDTASASIAAQKNGKASAEMLFAVSVYTLVFSIDAALFIKH